MDDKSNVAPVAAALIADSAIFKASGNLDKALQPLRDLYGTLTPHEVKQMMSGTKIVFKPQDSNSSKAD